MLIQDDEMRRLLDYLINTKQLSPVSAAQVDGAEAHSQPGICVIDADDLLDYPEQVVEAYCKAVDLDYSPQMLKWGSEESQQRAKEAFEKWNGWHDDALDSTELKAREHVSYQVIAVAVRLTICRRRPRRQRRSSITNGSRNLVCRVLHSFARRWMKTCPPTHT